MKPAPHSYELVMLRLPHRPQLFVETVRQLGGYGLVGKSGKVRVEGIAVCLVLNFGHEAQRFLNVIVLDELDDELRVADRRTFRIGCCACQRETQDGQNEERAAMRSQTRDESRLTKSPEPVPVFALNECVKLDVPVALVRHLEVGS